MCSKNLTTLNCFNDEKSYFTEDEFIQKIKDKEISGGIRFVNSYLKCFQDALCIIAKSKNIRVSNAHIVCSLIKVLTETEQIGYMGECLTYNDGKLYLPKSLENYYRDNKIKWENHPKPCVLNKVVVKLNDSTLENILNICNKEIYSYTDKNHYTLKDELNHTDPKIVTAGISKLLTSIRKSLESSKPLPISKNDFSKLHNLHVISYNINMGELCDICKSESVVLYDVKLPIESSYGCVCYKCFKNLNCKLGNGKGELLIPKDSEFSTVDLFE